MLAIPPTSKTAGPKLLLSIWNCTVPLGVPAGGEVLTVAVNVTL
jgi:hypothetical protein